MIDDELMAEEKIMMAEALIVKQFIKDLINWFVYSLFIFKIIVIFMIYVPRSINEVLGI